MEKGEIARYEQFLLFPQCFQKACFPGVSKGVVVWEWVNRGSNLQPSGDESETLTTEPPGRGNYNLDFV